MLLLLLVLLDVPLVLLATTRQSATDASVVGPLRKELAHVELWEGPRFERWQGGRVVPEACVVPPTPRPRGAKDSFKRSLAKRRAIIMVVEQTLSASIDAFEMNEERGYCGDLHTHTRMLDCLI